MTCSFAALLAGFAFLIASQLATAQSNEAVRAFVEKVNSASMSFFD